MYRKDYLDQQIQQLGKVLARMVSEALGLKQGSGNEIEAVNQTLSRELDLSLDALASIPESELIAQLLSTGKFNDDNLEKLADLLLLVAAQTQNNHLLLRRCLLIYDYVDQSGRTFSVQRQANSNLVRARLENQ